MHATRWARPGAMVAAAWMAVASPAPAQPASAGPPALREAFEAAWSRQPELRAADARREVGRAALAAARRWMPGPPALELVARTDRFTRNHGGREIEAVVAVPLWLPDERPRAEAAALAESTSFEARLAAARWRLAGEVRDAHWAGQRALLDIELAHERLHNVRQLAADVARRVDAGDLARSDRHQAQAAVAAAESAIAEAAVARSTAAQRWSALTGGVAPKADVAPEAELPESRSHPVLRELEAGVDVARRQGDLAGAQRRANAELIVGAARERGDAAERYSQGLIVGVRIPLGTQAGSQARVATAGAQQVEAEVQLALAREHTQREIEAARERLAAFERSAVAAERRALLLRESRGFFEKSFRLGETDLPTRLRAEFDAAEADRQAARARLERAAAVSQLNQALGALPE